MTIEIAGLEYTRTPKKGEILSVYIEGDGLKSDNYQAVKVCIGTGPRRETIAFLNAATSTNKHIAQKQHSNRIGLAKKAIEHWRSEGFEVENFATSYNGW